MLKFNVQLNTLYTAEQAIFNAFHVHQFAKCHTQATSSYNVAFTISISISILWWI